MSYPMEDQMTDAGYALENGQGTDIGQPQSYRITRSGRRPLKFMGSEIAMAMSFTPELPYWYEINLYRTTNSDFVAAVKLFHVSEDKRDTVEAWKVQSLDEALSLIEHYDAAHDVEFSVSRSVDEMSGAEVAVHALKLQAEVRSARQHYRGLAGEVLAELDAD